MDGDSSLDRPLAAEWFPELYDELRRIAGHKLSDERLGHTLSATALVHEAFVKLSPRSKGWSDSVRFRAAASKAMRQILCEHARARGAVKRGKGAKRITLAEGVLLGEESDDQLELLDLHDAIEALSAVDVRKAQGVELRFFGGLQFDEIAEIQEVSPRTVEADWYVARAWLRKHLGWRTEAEEQP